MLWLLVACGEDPCVPTTWHADADGDGFGGALTVDACEQPDGFVDNADDCNDGDAAQSPRGLEACDDVDWDCSGDPWDVLDMAEWTIWYLDSDGDGYGAGDERWLCEPPEGHVDNDLDCDDTNADRSPETRWHEDHDGDGFGSTIYFTEACERPDGHVLDSQDCDDGDAGVNPDAVEVCNGWDDDCDGLVDDDDDVDTATWVDWYADTDGDGYGGAFVVTACDGGSGTVADGTDCDDTEAAVNPGEFEVCDDGLDNDCSGDANDCGIGGQLSSVDADQGLEGEASGDNFGFRMLAEDLDGDGADDLLVGAPYNDHQAGNAGAAYLWNGPVSGDADAAWYGLEVRAGWDVGAGDFDGDGQLDVLLGQGTLDASVAYLVYGGTPLGDVTFGAGDLVGAATQGVGDLDDDGLDDLLVSAPSDGQAWLFLGDANRLDGSLDATDASVVIAASADSGLGWYGHSVDHGDLDGDGVADLVLGGLAADGYAGAAWVFLNDPGDVGDADVELTGSGSDRLGHAVGVLPDLDGDGLDDLVVSAPYDGDGTVSVYSGGTAWATFEANSGADAFGWSLDAGDLDGDGTNDLVVGARYWEDGSIGAYSQGAAFVFHGPVSGGVEGDEDARIHATDNAAFLGSDVGVADLDGDGVDDLVTGQLDDAGSVQVFLGGGL